jgi:hypothetical protein
MESQINLSFDKVIGEKMILTLLTLVLVDNKKHLFVKVEHLLILNVRRHKILRSVNWAVALRSASVPHSLGCPDPARSFDTGLQTEGVLKDVVRRPSSLSRGRRWSSGYFDILMDISIS